ncbi:hypothetical protein LR48_Vigan01g323200 [Vigna angularis]|uniref:Uncharacterized protein n=1 Tax=Phaseolus angularis TaxID=3914 RepID=A0A0L9TT51_PHAAN|nr:hypothetical protein LR48_Vigan01g323200 [Vigna angularis]
MFGSARIFSDVALRLRQNLSLRGVRVQNINIGGGMGGEIPDNKRLEYALQHLHGIGRSKAHHIVCELGVENKFVKDLSKRELYSIRELLANYCILPGFLTSTLSSPADKEASRHPYQLLLSPQLTY